MAKKYDYLRAYEINNLYDWAKEKGFEFPTELKAVSDAHSRIVNSNNVRAGYVRTMKEANEYLKKRYGEKAILFTRESYNKELKSLNVSISKQTSKFTSKPVEGVVGKKAISESGYAKDKIALENGISKNYLKSSLRNVSKTTLHEYMQQASDETSSNGAWKNYGFYQRLVQIIYEEIKSPSGTKSQIAFATPAELADMAIATKDLGTSSVEYDFLNGDVK